MTRRWALAWSLCLLWCTLIFTVLTVACQAAPSTRMPYGEPDKYVAYKLLLTTGETENVSCANITYGSEATYIKFSCFTDDPIRPSDVYMVTQFHREEENQ